MIIIINNADAGEVLDSIQFESPRGDLSGCNFSTF
jgi:hypothetical protein